MLRGAIPGSGRPFNLGEATVTRCSLRLAASSAIGVGYVLGRDQRHAALAAVFDGLLQDDQGRRFGLDRLVLDLQREREVGRAAVRAEAATTEVDFSMLIRE